MSLVGDTLIDGLPNLKIEIENDLDQKMDTDGDATASSETEEGEVVDDEEEILPGNSSLAALSSQTVPIGRSILKYDTKEYVEIQHQTAVQNPKGAFVTGVNVFSPEEQAKLDKRAQRFGIEATEGKVLTEKLLKKLYKSMCVKPTDKNIRTEALHMRGTENMTTQDVFNYFKDYGPASLEWISDNSCNVVWLDDISAARALLGLSVHISGQPMPPSEPERRLSLSDSDVEMETQVNHLGPKEASNDSDNLSEESDAVTLDELDKELPPGRWRRGAPHSLAPCILLRFANTSDRSKPRPDFTKFGNHQSGGYVGLISESRKRRMQNALPMPLMFEDVGDEIIPKPSMDEKDNANPWGTLAKTWSQFDKVRKPRPPSPVIERILPLPTRITPPPSPPRFLTSRSKLVARRRNPTVVRRVSDPEGGDSSDPDEWRSRSKVPRMRMHADDEEKKLEKRLKRGHRNRSLSRSPSRAKDLRHKLVLQKDFSDVEDMPTNETEPTEAENEEAEDEVPDLRVAVPAERTNSPEDSKIGIRQSLFLSGNVKSVLKGARGYSENDEDDEDEKEEDEESQNSEETDRVRRSGRRHRSRSKERRKHHRKHKKESSHHKTRRRDEESDDSDDELPGKMKSTIKRISPEEKDTRSESKESRIPWERRKRKDDDYKRSDRDKRRHGESRSGKESYSKRSHRHKTHETANEFRSKSPLQIEIDNDEYYNKAAESD